MKNIKLLLLISSVVLASCTEDFLDTVPLTDITDTNFYKTPLHAYNALTGCYDGMQVASGGIGGLSFPVASEVLSDDCFGGTGNSDGFGFQAVDEFDISRSPIDANLFENLWIAYYEAIFRCNVFLQKIDQTEWGNEEYLRPIYESETRVIRAHLYFEMVRLWGNIPLVTEPTTENIPQADPDEVYTVIAEDLLFAAENLPDVAYSTVDNGRITKWSAKSMLARVFLYYTGYYGQSDLVGLMSQTEALAHLEDVITTSGHGLVNDFSTLWPLASLDNYAGEDNSEIVFSIKHTYTSNYDPGDVDGNHWIIMFGMREFEHAPYGRGWGVTVNPDLWNAYNANDTRASATIIGIDEEAIPFDKIPNQREYTGYYNKKYAPVPEEVIKELGGQDLQIGQFQDYILIRYSDVLLMAAELGSGNAQNYFDQVRERAYQSNFTSIPATEANILNERHLEFALEGIRYWDILRQGVGTAANILAESQTVLTGGEEETKTILASNVELTKGLQQIPNNQITLSNSTLEQNEGW